MEGVEEDGELAIASSYEGGGSSAKSSGLCCNADPEVSGLWTCASAILLSISFLKPIIEARYQGLAPMKRELIVKTQKEVTTHQKYRLISP